MTIDGAAMSGEEFTSAHPGPNGEAKAFDLDTLCLSPAEWEARDIEPEDTLLGPFSATTRTELSADTGLGKTMFGLALAHAKSLGRDFLHWNAARRARCLFLDGEMPGGLIKARLKVARSWFDLNEPLGREWLCVLSREDVPDMPPLDTPEGARFALNLFDQLGRFDHVTFDNRACLAIGDLSGEDASTTALKTLQRQITKIKTGQAWLHHTGHDGTRGYGRKAREWELDTVMVGERLDKPGTDVAFTLKVPKCRRRTPDNRADFDPVEIELREGQWTWKPAPTAANGTGKMPAAATVCLDALRKALAELGKPPPASSSTIGVHAAVTVAQWRDIYGRMSSHSDDQSDARRKAFQRGSERLLAEHLVAKWGDWVWLRS